MTASVSMLVRHPLKAIGRETLEGVDLVAGHWMPFDRLWAVTHERTQPDGGWLKKVNFLRGVSAPSLMAVTCRLDESEAALSLTHPAQDPIAVRPDRDGDVDDLIAWLRHIWPDDMPRPTGVYRAAKAHLTDVPEPWISIKSTSSLRAFSQRAGTPLSPHRFRGNIWLDGLAPWEEANWIGKSIRIGGATLMVRAQITRCKATMANPETGRRDADTLGVLNELGHQEFGVYAEVLEGGAVSVGDPVAL